MNRLPSLPSERTLSSVWLPVCLWCCSLLSSAAQTLSHAVNNPGKIFDAGSPPTTPWLQDAVVTHDAVLAARSGSVGHNSNSVMSTTVTGPVTLSFWWKVSSEADYDKLLLLVDGSVLLEESGEQNWQRSTFALGAGAHTVVWKYAKDVSLVAGQDAAWVDEVAFTPPAGDVDPHIDALFRQGSLSSTVLNYNDPASNTFKAQITADFQRLDETNVAPVAADLPIKITWTVQDMHTGAAVDVAAGDYFTSVNLATHGGGAQPLPAVASLVANVPFTAGANLSVNPSWPYRIIFALSYTAPDGSQVGVGGMQQDNVHLLTLSGRLLAGTVEARFNQISWSPGTVAVSGAGYTFEVDSAPNACWLLDSPTTRFRLNFQSVYRDPNSGDITLQAGGNIVLGNLYREIANIRYTVENTTLSTAGFTGAGIRVTLPAGMGVLTSATSRLAEAEIFFAGAAIQLDGTPVQPTLDYFPAGSLYVTHEQLPVRQLVEFLTWNVAAGTIGAPDAIPTYERAREMGWLASDLAGGELKNPGAASKLSNESIYQRVNPGDEFPVSIKAGADHRALLTTALPLNGLPPGQSLTMHFPGNVALPMSGGLVRVVDGGFDAASFLTLSAPLSVPFERNCPDAPECGVTNAASIPLSVSVAGNLQITPDGGWRGTGTLSGGAVSWGGMHGTQPTHALTNIPSVSLHVPGFQLAPEAVPAVTAPKFAAAMLLSGIGQPGNPNVVERPDSAGYALGLSDYAGLNIRGTGLTARSHLAGKDTGNYSLKSTSKYIVRVSGITGIHDAVTAGFPKNLALYDYQTQLDGLRLSFVDSRNEESATAGSMALPFPADFTVPFNKLTFTCGGHLDAADLDTAAGPFDLSFWGCQLTPRFLDFTPQRPDKCTTNKSYLTLGGEFSLGFVSDQKVQGALAFLPNGNIAPPSLNLADGIDGSLAPPPNLALKGRGQLTFPFTPATRLRFVNYDLAAADFRTPGGGWLFAAGNLDVPFFEDMRVLLHLQPAAINPTHVIGGWPTDPSQADYGWSPAGKNYFNTTAFDPDNRSAPDISNAAALADFRHGGSTVPFVNLPRARKDWRGLVRFDFPMQWDATARQFGPAGNPEHTLLVLKAQAQVRTLDAAGADIVFGASFEGLPKATAALLYRAFDTKNLPLPGSPDKMLADSLAHAFANAISGAALREGRKAMDELLGDALDQLADARVLEAGYSLSSDATFASLYSDLRQDYTLGGMARVSAQWDARTGPFRQYAKATLASQILAGADGISGLLKETKDRLEKAEAAVDQLLKLCDPNQPIAPGPAIVDALASTNPFLQAWVRRMMQDKLGKDYIATVSNGISSTLLDLLGQDMNDLKPVLRQIYARLRSTKLALQAMRQSFEGFNGGLRDLRAVIIAATGGASAELVDQALAVLKGDITTSRDASGDWFGEHNLAAVSTRFAQLLLERFHASTMSSELRSGMRRLVEPLQKDLHQGLDLVFSAVNSMVNNLTLQLVKQFQDYLAANPNPLLNGLLAGGAEAFKGAQSALGDFPNEFEKATSVLQFAKVEGHARTKGDTLEELRVDANIGLSVPDKIGAQGFILIRNLDRDTPSTSCRAPGVVRTEVTLGYSGGLQMSAKKEADSNAREMKNFAGSMEGRFSFGTSELALPGGLRLPLPNGFDGQAGFEGDIEMGVLSLQKVQLQLGLGGTEAYATADAKGSVWFLEVDAHLFMGATRQLSILNGIIDPQLRKAVIDPLPRLAGEKCLQFPVVGLYGRAGGFISVNRFFGIPDSCLLRLKAGRQMGEYALVTGVGSPNVHVNVGIRDALDIQGDVLCVGVTGQAGLLFNLDVNASRIANDGFGSVLESINGTATGWAKGCVNYLIGEACAEVSIVIGVKPNPAVAPPLLFYPIRIDY